MEINIKLEEGKIYKANNLCSECLQRYRLHNGKLEVNYWYGIEMEKWEESGLTINDFLDGWRFEKVPESPKEYTLAELLEMNLPSPTKIKSAVTRNVYFIRMSDKYVDKIVIYPDCSRTRGMYVDELQGKWTIVKDE